MEMKITTITARKDIIAELMTEPITKVIGKLAWGNINQLENWWKEQQNKNDGGHSQEREKVWLSNCCVGKRELCNCD